MEKLVYVDRKGSGSLKWDDLENVFGEGSSSLLPLWIADADFKSPVAVLDVLEKWATHGVYGYSGEPAEYRQSIINWEGKRHGYAVQSDWIRYSPGVVTGLHWIVGALTQPGDGVMLLTPVYYPFFNIIENTRRKVVKCWLNCDKGVYTIDFDAFERRIIDDNVKLYIHCSPHNPVGRVWTKEENLRIADICRRHNVIVASDEIHQDLIMPGHTHIPMGTLMPEAVTITSASKTFNIAGLANAYSLFPCEEHRASFDKYMKSVNVNHAVRPSYLAIIAAYDHGKEWLDSFIAKIMENYGVLCDIIGKGAPEVVISPLEGTYLAWLDLRAFDKVKTAKEFAENICSFAADYGDWFGQKDYERHFRINLATKTEHIERAARAIVDGLK